MSEAGFFRLEESVMIFIPVQKGSASHVRFGGAGFVARVLIVRQLDVGDFPCELTAKH